VNDSRPERFALGSLDLAEVGAEFVRSLERAKPELFDGVTFVFAERYSNAPAGHETWHIRIAGHTVSAGLGVPDDVDMLVEADYAVAAQIGTIVYGNDTAARAKANALAAAATAAGKMRVDILDRDHARKVKPLGLADGMHDAMAARVARVR
jgi:hypothetical protein